MLQAVSAVSNDLPFVDNTSTTTRTSPRTHLRKRRRASSRSSTSPSSIDSTRKFALHAAGRTSSPRIVLGPGVLGRLPTELSRLGLSTPLIVSSPSRVDVTTRILAITPNLNARVLDSSVVESFPALRMDGDVIASISGRDCVISVGGGSAVALARTLGLRKGIPHICIPTTHSGNEFRMSTSLYPAKIQHRQFRGRPVSNSKTVYSKPVVIIYDEDLTTSATRTISAPSGTSMHMDSQLCHRAKTEDELWSYLHLPGV
ncbi:hypothetical protein AK830_g1901 [Neonectria ditissima]|uniref:Alcohol dehydrogenase iron-type/glycerol dehydrogenase GldA domain-containing protein n=1 Tax=Neonectria ditissima TaxID=78410 RepID=A0A0P7BXS4_9HYPO|nr:hypothetical protein AK830_g1901 [Neonectria ditissima]